MAQKTELPKNKKSFKIGEVARLLEVEPYVLRYWETEFKQLSPDKSRSGQRIYKRSDIEDLTAIRELLYVEQYTIAGARRQLDLGRRTTTTPEQAVAIEDAERANQKLEEQAQLLSARVQTLELSLAHQAESRREAISESESRAEQLSARIDELLERLDEAHTELDASRLQIGELERELERAGGIDERWSQMTSQLGEDVERQAQQLQMSQQLNTELEAAHAELAERCQSLDMERERAQAHCAELLTQRAQLEAHCDELSARLRAMRQGRQRTFERMRHELISLHEHVMA